MRAESEWVAGEGWLSSGLAGWLAGCQAGQLAGRQAGSLVDWLAGWQALGCMGLGLRASGWAVGCGGLGLLLRVMGCYSGLRVATNHK